MRQEMRKLNRVKYAYSEEETQRLIGEGYVPVVSKQKTDAADDGVKKKADSAKKQNKADDAVKKADPEQGQNGADTAGQAADPAQTQNEKMQEKGKDVGKK